MKKTLLLIVSLFVLQFVSAQSNSAEDNTPYRLDLVDIAPQFPGGYNAFVKYVSNSFEMPEYEGAGGTLKMSFIVEKDGTISSVKVIEDVGDGALAKEAKRVIETSPLWAPGYQLDGKIVRVIYEFPMQFVSNYY
jgi:hypothetical protein